MTVSALAVFAATCSQVFTGWHYEFTFSNDTVTALGLECGAIFEVKAPCASKGSPRPHKSVLTRRFAELLWCGGKKSCR
jgi:hypothetical protein